MELGNDILVTLIMKCRLRIDTITMWLGSRLFLIFEGVVSNKMSKMPADKLPPPIIMSANFLYDA